MHWPVLHWIHRQFVAEVHTRYPLLFNEGVLESILDNLVGGCCA